MATRNAKVQRGRPTQAEPQTIDEQRRVAPEDSISKTQAIREQAREVEEQRRDSEEFTEFRANQRRERVRDVRKKANFITRQKPSLKKSVTGIKVATALASVSYVLIILYILQVIGAIIAIGGLLLFFGLDDVLFFGSLLSENTGGPEIWVLGTGIAFAAGALSYLGVMVLLLFRRVNPFPDFNSYFVFSVTLAAHALPVANLAPLGLFWVSYIVVASK